MAAVRHLKTSLNYYTYILRQFTDFKESLDSSFQSRRGLAV